MLVWRICQEKHVANAFGGAGAEKSGGRWNHKGVAIVYTSSSLSLAALELFVHLEPNLMPADLYSVAATVPATATIEEFTVADLPSNWRAYPAPTALQEAGSRWIREQRSFALIVPSAVNPEEKNVLLNLNYPRASELIDMGSKPFHFDARMFK